MNIQAIISGKKNTKKAKRSLLILLLMAIGIMCLFFNSQVTEVHATGGDPAVEETSEVPSETPAETTTENPEPGDGSTANLEPGDNPSGGNDSGSDGNDTSQDSPTGEAEPAGESTPAPEGSGETDPEGTPDPAEDESLPAETFGEPTPEGTPADASLGNFVDPKGTIYDAITKKAIEEATVILQRWDDDSGAYVDYGNKGDGKEYTSTNGKYSFDLVSGFDYQIIASADGYLSYGWEFSQDDDTEHKIDFYLVLESSGISSGWVSVDNIVTIVDDIFTNGHDVEIRAPDRRGEGEDKEAREDPFESIILADGKVISTRNLTYAGDNHNTDISNGNSGSIKMRAHNITIGADAQLLAHVINGESTIYTAGDITLEALASAETDVMDLLLANVDHAKTSITVSNGAIIKAGVITFAAISDCTHINIPQDGNQGEEGEDEVEDKDIIFDESETEEEIELKLRLAGIIEMGEDLLYELSQTVHSSLEGFTLIGGVAISRATSIITIGDGSLIEAYSFAVNSEAIINASAKPIAIGVAVAVAIGASDAQVILNGEIRTTGNCTINALADNTMVAVGNSAGIKGFGAGAAVSILSSQSKIQANNTAIFDVGGNLSLQAKTIDRTYTRASSAMASEGKVGIAVAVGIEDGITAVSLGGIANVVGNISVKALMEKDEIKDTVFFGRLPTVRSGVNANAGTNMNLSSDVPTEAQKAVNKKITEAFMDSQFMQETMNGMKDQFKTANAKTEEKTETSDAFPFAVSAAVAYYQDTNRVMACIADNAKVKAQGNINVYAKAENQPALKSTGAAKGLEGKSGDDGGTEGDGAKFAGSAAVAVGLFTNEVTAYIGNNAEVDAGANLEVKAEYINNYELTYGIELIECLIGDNGYLNSQETDKTINKGDIVEVLEGHAEDKGEIGSLYKYIGENSLNNIDLSTIDYTGSDWEDLGSDWSYRRTQLLQKLTGYMDTSVGLSKVPNFWTQSSASNGEVGVSGSISVLISDNAVKAYIGEKAKINQDTNYRTSQQNVSVISNLVDETITFSGNIVLPGVDLDPHTFNIHVQMGGKGTEASTAAVGASVVVYLQENESRAEIWDEVVLFADKLDILADTKVLNVVVAAAGGDAGKYAFEGTFTFVDLDNNSVAWLSNTANLLVDKENLTIKAVDNSFIVNAAGVLTESGNAGVGATIGLNLVTRSTKALVDSGETVGYEPSGAAIGKITINNGDLSIEALNDGFIISVSVAGTIVEKQKPKAGAAKKAPKEGEQGGDYGVGISANVSINIVQDEVMAAIRFAAIEAKSTRISSSNYTQVIAVGGTVAIVTKKGTSTALAGAYAQNTITNINKAIIDNSELKLSADGDLILEAESIEKIIAVSASGAVSTSDNSYSVAGQISVNIISHLTEASVKDSVINNSSDKARNITIRAIDNSSILAIAGALAYGGKAGIGAAVAWNQIKSADDIPDKPGAILAYIQNSDINVTGDISLSAESDNYILAVTAAVGASKGNMAAAVAISMNLIDSDTQAYIIGKKLSGVYTDGAVTLSAINNSTILTVAGGLAYSKNASVGVAGAYNEISGTIKAFVGEGNTPGSETIVKAGSLSLQALSEASIFSISAGASASSGQAAINGSISINTITNDLATYIKNSTVEVENSIDLIAEDTSEIISIAGAVGGAQTAAVGAALAVNYIGSFGGLGEPKYVHSYIENSQVLATNGGITISALSLSDIKSVSASGGGSSNTAVFGSVSLNFINNDIAAFIKDCESSVSPEKQIKAQGDISLSAIDKSTIHVAAGNVSGAGTASVGASIAISYIGNGDLSPFDKYIDNRQYEASEPNDDYDPQEEDFDYDNLIFIESNKVRVYIDNSLVESIAGKLILKAQNESSIKSISAGTAIGGTAGVQASVSVNYLYSNVWAQILNSIATAKKDIVLEALSQGSSIQSLAGSLSGSGVAGVGISLAVNHMANSYLANIENSEVTSGTKGISLKALNEAGISSISASGGGGEVGVNGSVAINSINNQVLAYIVSSTVKTHQDINLLAYDYAEIGSIAGAISGGYYAAVGASVAVNYIGTNGNPHLVEAYILNSDVESEAGKISIKADSNSIIKSISAAGGGALVGVNGAVSVNWIYTNTAAFIKNDTGVDKLVTAKNDITLDAVDRSSISVIAGTISGGGGADGASVAIVFIGNGTLENGDPAKNNQEYKNDGDDFTYDKPTFDEVDGNSKVIAFIENSNVKSTDGSIILTAKDNTVIFNISAGVAAGGVGSQGSVSINYINTGISAYILKGNVEAGEDIKIQALTEARDSIPTSALQVDSTAGTSTSFDGGAEDTGSADNLETATKNSPEVLTNIQSIAGSVAGGGLDSSGIAIAVNYITNSYNAFVRDSVLKATGDILIKANNLAGIESVSAAAAAAANTKVGSVSFNLIINDIFAYTTSSDLTAGNITAGNIKILASDNSTIKSVSGQVNFSGTQGLGAAAAYNQISNTIKAYVDKDSALTKPVLTAANNIEIQSLSAAKISTIGASGSVSSGLAGSATVIINIITNKVSAYIADANVTADNNIYILAQSINETNSYGGSIGGGVAVGIGAAAIVNVLTNDTEAYIVRSTVKALGADTATSIPVWDADGKKQSSGQAANGLFIIAYNKEAITVYSGSAGIGIGGAGVSGQVSTNIIINTTEAYIDSSSINNDTDKGELAILRAVQDSGLQIFAGSLAVGFSPAEGIAVGGAVDATVITNETRAFIKDSTVYAGSGVEVMAITSLKPLIDNKPSLIIAGAALSNMVSLAGAVSVVVTDNINEAFIENSNVYSLDYIKVLSSHNIQIEVCSAAASASTFLGAGGTVIVSSFTNNSLAEIRGSDLNARGAIELLARSRDDIKVTVGTAGVGLTGLGVAGAVSVILVETRTEASVISFIINENVSRISKLNQDLHFQPDGIYAPANSSNQSIIIKADNETNVETLAGSLGAGLLGFGAALDYTSIQNRTVAMIGIASKIYAAGNITLEALSEKTVDSKVYSVGGGLIGISGAVSIVTVGTPISQDAADEFTDDLTTQINNDTSKDSWLSYKDDDGNMISRLPGDSVGLIAAQKIETANGPNVGAALDPHLNTSSRITAAFVQNATEEANKVEIKAGGNVNIHAQNTNALVSKTDNTTVAAGGAGVTVSYIFAADNTYAYLGSYGYLRSDNLAIKAETFIKVKALGEAVAATIVGVNGYVAYAEVKPVTTAYIGNNADVLAARDIQIDAEVTPEVSAEIKSVNVAIGGNIGASFATVLLEPEVTAYIGDYVRAVAASLPISGEPELTLINQAELSGNPNLEFKGYTIRLQGEFKFERGVVMSWLDGWKFDFIAPILVEGGNYTVYSGIAMSGQPELVGNWTDKTIIRKTGYWTDDDFKQGDIVLIQQLADFSDGFYEIKNIIGSKITLEIVNTNFYTDTSAAEQKASISKVAILSDYDLYIRPYYYTDTANFYSADYTPGTGGDYDTLIVEVSTSLPGFGLNIEKGEYISIEGVDGRYQVMGFEELHNEVGPTKYKITLNSKGLVSPGNNIETGGTLKRERYSLQLKKENFGTPEKNWSDYGFQVGDLIESMVENSFNISGYQYIIQAMSNDGYTLFFDPQDIINIDSEPSDIEVTKNTIYVNQGYDKLNISDINSADDWEKPGFAIGDDIHVSVGNAEYLCRIVGISPDGSLILDSKDGLPGGSGNSVTVRRYSTILRSGENGGGSWLYDGFSIGDTIVVSGTRYNNGKYTIKDLNDKALFLADGEDDANLTNETYDGKADSVEISGDFTLEKTTVSGSGTETTKTILKRTSGNWSDIGFQVGDEIAMVLPTSIPGLPDPIDLPYTYKILEINGDELIIFREKDLAPEDPLGVNSITHYSKPGQISIIAEGKENDRLTYIGDDNNWWVNKGFYDTEDEDNTIAVRTPINTDTNSLEHTVYSHNRGSYNIIGISDDGKTAILDTIGRLFSWTIPDVDITREIPSEITRTTGTWHEDGFAPGQTIIINGAENAANNGAFDILEIINEGRTLRLEKGQELVNENLSGKNAIGNTGNRIVRVSGSWVKDGFNKGQKIRLTGSEEGNDGVYEILDISADGKVLMLTSNYIFSSETSSDLLIVFEDIYNSNIKINALIKLPATGTTAQTKAEGLSGSIASANSVEATVKVKPLVKAYIGNNSIIDVDGNMEILAKALTSQMAEVDTTNIGALAVSANIAKVETDSRVEAQIGTGSRLTALDLQIKADGNEKNFAKAKTGNGGLVGGAVTEAETDSKSETKATIGKDAKISVRVFEIIADHLIDYNSQVDTFSVAFAGLGGSLAENIVDSDVNIQIGDGAEIQAYDIRLVAKNSTLKDWLANGEYNVKAAAGAVAGASVATSESLIEQQSWIDIGAASLKVIGDILFPGSLTLDAKNIITARDRVSLETAAVINLALAESIIRANNKALINIGQGANLESVGDINLAALTIADIEAKTNVKTSGVAPAAVGKSIAQADVENRIDIGGDVGSTETNLYADGKINLLLGQDTAEEPNLNSISVVALTDIDNHGAAPLYSDPEVDGIINLNNFIIIGSKALLQSVSDTNLLIERGITIASGKGVGTDWIKSALGAEISIYNSTINVNPIIRVDGTVKAGVRSQQIITINKDGDDIIIVVNGTTLKVNKADDGSVNLTDELEYIVDSVDGITITVIREILANYMMDELAMVRQLAMEYAGTEAGDAFSQQVIFLEQELKLLGYTDDDGKPLPPAWVDIIIIGLIKAEQGNINVLAEGGSLIGSGELIASSQAAKIEITNNSPAYLELEGLIIPENEGGRLTYNYAQILTSKIEDINAEINSRNIIKGANFTEVTTMSTEETRTIKVENTSYGEGGQAPDIKLMGPVQNIGTPAKPGSVWIEGKGGISAYSSLDAGDLHIEAAGRFSQSYIDTFFDVGGSPRALWSDLVNQWQGQKFELPYVYISGYGWFEYPGMSSMIEQLLAKPIEGVIRADNIFIAARYLNINGTIEAGSAPDTIVFGEATNLIINYYKGNLTSNDYKDYALGNNSYYDPITKSIIVEPIYVRGGYIQLFGHIINTAQVGKIVSFDGYGKIEIDNQTNYDLIIKDLDTGMGKSGIIVITDTSKKKSGTDDVYMTTKYERDGNNIKITSIYSDGSPTGIAGKTVSGRVAEYQPTEGYRFEWVMGQRMVERRIETYRSKSWLGVDWLAKDPDDLYESYSWKDGKPVLMPEGEYLILRTGNNKAGVAYADIPYLYWYQYKEDTVETQIGYRNWSEQSWFLAPVWYYDEYTYQKGYIEVYYHSIKADYPIAIEFSGIDTASVEIKSPNSNVTIDGTIRNSTGQVSITAGKNINANTDLAIVANEIILQAETGIGLGLPVGVIIEGATISAKTESGDINIRGMAGNLTIGTVESKTDNVSLEAVNDIIGSAVKGNLVELLSRYGAIHGTNSNDTLHINTGNAKGQGLIAQAKGDINLRYFDDLRIISIVSDEGDINIYSLYYGDPVQGGRVAGNLIDGKGEYVGNADLLALWSTWSTKEDNTYTAQEIQDFLEYARRQQISDTNYWTRLPNIIGRNINFVVENAAIGVEEKWRINLESGQVVLTAEMATILAGAMPVEVLFYNSSDNIIYNLSENTADYLIVTLKRALTIEANGVVKVQGYGDVYLDSAQDLNVEKIHTSSHEVRIRTKGNIYNASTDGTGYIRGANIFLEAVGGSIGSDTAPLIIVQTNSGHGRLTARAGDSIYLSSIEQDNFYGTIDIDYIFAPNLVELQAVKEISDTNRDNKVNIIAGNLTLKAKSIARKNNLLEVIMLEKDGTSGLLEAVASDGDIYLEALEGNLNLSLVSATTDIILKAAKSILNASPNTDLAMIKASKAGLFAGEGLGSVDNYLLLELEFLEAVATAGGIWLQNDDPLTVGDVSDGLAGLNAQGPIYIIANKGITVNENISALEEIVIIVPDTVASGDDILVAASSIVRSEQAHIILKAGDNITLALGSALMAVDLISLYIDYDNADRGIGGTLTLSGIIQISSIVQAPTLLIEGNEDNDQFFLNSDLLGVITSIKALAGDDIFYFADGISLTGTIDGGDGNDTLDYSAYQTGIDVNLTEGSASNVSGGAIGCISNIENVTGGSGDDTIIGNGQDNILRGGPGNDYLYGMGGNDILDGGDGNDYLDGGSGDDFLISGSGQNTLIGGDGYDTAIITHGSTYSNAPNDIETFTELEEGVDTCIVTFSINFKGSTDTYSPVIVYLNKAYGDLPTPERTGYTFNGWFTADSGGELITAETVVIITGIQKLYGRWTANNYKVTFDTQGGTATSSNKTVTYDSPYGDLPEPSRTGYTFEGWFTEASCGDLFNSDTIVTIADNHTLYAQWTANEYQVTFDAQGGTVAQDTITVTYDTTYGELFVPTRKGYDFEGWFTEEIGGNQVTADTEVKITDDQILYARWTIANFAGPVNIIGTAKYLETITADTSETNNTGTLTYQWKRGDQLIGENRDSYTLVFEDIGQVISCELTSSVQPGTLAAITSTILKADGPAVTGVSKTNCTTSANNDGTLIGITVDMEYKLSTEDTWTNGADNWVDGEDNIITALANGSYLVRVKETDTHSAGPESTFIIAAYRPPSSGGGGSTTPPVETVAPISGGEQELPLAIETSGDTANVKPLEEEDLQEIVEAAAAAGNAVAIDLSSIDDTVDTAVLPSNLLTGVVQSASAGLAITMPDGKNVSFDKTALDALAAAGSGDLNLMVRTVPSETLTDSERKLVGNATIIDLTAHVGDKQVSDFGGGKVTVSVPVIGEPTDHPIVWRMITDADGKVRLEAIECTYNPETNSYQFQTGSFSKYVLSNYPFTDTPNSAWYYGDAVYAYVNGLFSGTTDTTFSPDLAMTRAMLVTILWRMENEPQASAASFTDVNEGSYYADAIVWASANGIVSGYGKGVFGPDDNITREQLAAILHRYAKYKGYDVSVGEDTNILSYKDAFDIAEYAISAMQWACGSGLIQGSNGNLTPRADATRAQVAAVLHRFTQSNVK